MCRKRENVAVRQSRSVTCGMLYAYRTCGISVGHIELIRSGILTILVLKFLVYTSRVMHRFPSLPF